MINGGSMEQSEKQVSNYKQCFKHDRDKYYIWKLGSRPSFLAKLKFSFLSFELHCVAAFRFDQMTSRFYKRHKLFGLIPRIISKIFSSIIHLFHHVDIDTGADIGPGFFITHASGIMIGPTKIGKNFTVSHNTTIGWGFAEEGDGIAIPEIGDNVWVGVGAILSGKIQIADDVTISSGSVLSKSVPEKCLVAGNPGRIIIQEYKNILQARYSI
jgi:serine O-acetyltransferase